MIECIQNRDFMRKQILNKISLNKFNKKYENLLYWQQVQVLDVYKAGGFYKMQ